MKSVVFILAPTALCVAPTPPVQLTIVHTVTYTETYISSTGTTTTVTPWDSSASSGCNFLAAFNPFSLNQGVLASDSFGSAGSFEGSTASGTCGFDLQIWEWCVLAAVVCLFCCCCCSCARGNKKKRTVKKKGAPPPATESSAPVAEAEEDPLLLDPLMMMDLPPLLPLPASSYALPAPMYQMAAAPMQYQYAPNYAQYAQPSFANQPVQSFQYQGYS